MFALRHAKGGFREGIVVGLDHGFEESIPIDFAPVADNTNNNLLQFCVGKIKHPIITNANAKTVAIFQFFAAVRKRIFFQCKNSFSDAGLYLRGKAFKFLACVARDFNLPTHVRIFSSFNA